MIFGIRPFVSRDYKTDQMKVPEDILKYFIITSEIRLRKHVLIYATGPDYKNADIRVLYKQFMCAVQPTQHNFNQLTDPPPNHQTENNSTKVPPWRTYSKHLFNPLTGVIITPNWFILLLPRSILKPIIRSRSIRNFQLTCTHRRRHI